MVGPHEPGQTGNRAALSVVFPGMGGSLTVPQFSPTLHRNSPVCEKSCKLQRESSRLASSLKLRTNEAPPQAKVADRSAVSLNPLDCRSPNRKSTFLRGAKDDIYSCVVPYTGSMSS